MNTLMTNYFLMSFLDLFHRLLSILLPTFIVPTALRTGFKTFFRRPRPQKRKSLNYLCIVWFICWHHYCDFIWIFCFKCNQYLVSNLNLFLVITTGCKWSRCGGKAAPALEKTSTRYSILKCCLPKPQRVNM